MRWDAVVVGAGPNGLAAAIELAREGLRVLVRERARDPGGAVRTASLTEPGFLHDVGSAVYPLGAGSPFFRSLPLREHGLKWVHPELPLAHPLDGGGAGALTRALISYLTSLGGVVETDAPVLSLAELPTARAVLLDLAPRHAAEVAAAELPGRYRSRLEGWRHGPGAFKVDWALEAPIPWTAEVCRRAGTVHLGGTLEEISAGEAAACGGGEPAERPFVLLAQPSLFDTSRAPAGKHTAWAYCHVPHGSTVDVTERIEAQVERFAPGFRALVRARRVHGPLELEAWNPNLVGGDVSGGAPTLSQTFARPTLSMSPWATPVRDLYLCSAATPPGAGVHGMCGYHAARAALRRTFGR